MNMEDDGDDKDDTKRRTRNLSEKKRRDQFNMLVNELSTLITTNNRKMDKTTVLKSAISFLKSHNELTVRSRMHDVQEDWKPLFLANEEFTYLVLEAMEGFIIVFSANGQINYVSEGIMSLLGHNPIDVLNTSIFDLLPDADRQHIYTVIHNCSSMDHQLVNECPTDVKFQCHLKRGSLDFKDETTYELIDFIGRVRRNTEPMDGNNCQEYQSEQESSVVFVCTGRLHRPQLIRDETLLDSARCEFTSRHSLEWKFLFLDHRAPPIIGYLPFEVLGTSGYDYYHFDDLEKVITCHETLMQKGELTSCYYRFLTKGQQWIWLQTRFYITYHQWNSKPEFVVCTHRVVSYDDMAKSTKTEVVEEEAPEMESSNSQQTVKEPPAEDTAPQTSPSYYSENNDAFSYQQQTTQALSASSHGSTAGTQLTAGTDNASAGWPREVRRYAGSDYASVSNESRSSQRDHVLTPQHGIGVQYLEPLPYVSMGAPMIPVPAILPVPVVLDTARQGPDAAAAQEQLQRKHEKLQQMIMRQQEELRQVKEQLLLARLGILQPIIPVQTAYPTTDGMQAADPRLAAPLMFTADAARADVAYAQPPQPHIPNHMPHMPQ